MRCFVQRVGWLGLLVGASIVLVGCRTVSDIYREGRAAEQAGNVQEARARYLEALAEKPGYGPARARLEVLGNEMALAGIRRSDSLRALGDYVAAADLYAETNFQVRTLANAGVTVPLPPDYADRQAAAEAEAVADLLRRAETFLVQGRPDDALDRLAVAQTRFAQALSGERPRFTALRRRAQDQALDGLLAQGRTLYDAGRYDDALRTYAAASRYEPSAAQQQRFEAAQATATTAALQALQAEADAQAAAGDYAAAIAGYERALRQYSPTPAQRTGLERGLRSLQDQALDAARAEAAALAEDGRYDDALAELERARTTYAPSNAQQAALHADRRAVQDAALAGLHAYAEELTASGRFGDALDVLAQRPARYDPAPAQQADLQARRARVHLAWADALRDDGRYREAYERAGQVGQFQNLDPATLDALADLQRRIVDEGALRAALFPVEAQGGRATRDLPGGFAERLNDLLEDDYWSAPPLLVRIAEPSAVRRALRDTRNNAERRMDDDRLSADLGRRLEADFAVPADLDTYTRTLTERSRTRVAARLRDGRDTAFVRIEARLELTLASSYKVVQVSNRRVFCEDDFAHTVRANRTYAEFPGNAADLTLSRADRALFDEDALDEQEEDLETDLMAEAARDLSRGIFECLARQVR